MHKRVPARAPNYTRFRIFSTDRIVTSVDPAAPSPGSGLSPGSRQLPRPAEKIVALGVSPPGRVVPRVAHAALLGFALTAWVSTPVASVCLALLLITFVVDRDTPWRDLQRDPMMVLFAVSLVYLSARTLWGVLEWPETVHKQVGESLDWSKLWVFVLVAWWLRGEVRGILQVLGLALIGLLVSTASNLNSQKLGDVLAGLRPHLEFPALGFGLYTATAVLGLLLFATRIWGTTQRPGRFAARVAAWVAVLVVLVQGVITSQSRATWIAVLVVFPPLLVLRTLPWLRAPGKGHGPRTGWPVALAGLVILGLVGANLGPIKHRLLQERSSIHAVFSGRWQQLPPQDSVSYRAHLYQLGLDRWRERPFFGWGPGSAARLIQQSDIPAMRQFKEFHNTYLDVLVRMGLFGACLMGIGFWLLLRALWRARRAGSLPLDAFLCLGGAFALLAVWSAGDFRMVHADWRFYWVIFAGSAYTFQLRTSAHPSTPTRSRHQLPGGAIRHGQT
jgi:O-antigen ligase